MTTLDESGTQAPRGSILGTRVLRTEDPEFLTTGAVYTEDLVDERLAGAARATFVRSPVAHARILSIDTAEALAAPGVVAVYTAQDLDTPGRSSRRYPMYDAAFAQPLLADGVVRFVGEPVAVVLTDDRYSGEDAAELVAVDYDPLPRGGRHEGRALATRRCCSPTHGTNLIMSPRGRVHRRLLRRLRGRRHARRSSTSAWPSPRSRSAPPPRSWGDDGRLTLWIPNQGAQGTKSARRADARRRTPTDVRMITPDGRRRVRREVRRRPRARGRGVGGAAAWAVRSPGSRRARRTCWR